MKHLFLFAIITAIFSVACKKDEKENPSMKNTDVVTDSTLIHWSENPMLFSKQRDIEQVVHLTSDYDSLFFYVQNLPDWISLDSGSGMIVDTARFLVRRDTFRNHVFPMGITKDSLTFSTIHGEVFLELRYLNGIGTELVSPDTIVFKALEDDANFILANNTIEDLNYSLLPNSILSFSGNTGMLKANNYEEIQVSVNRALLVEDTSYIQSSVNFNGKSQPIVFQINHFIDHKRSIQGEVVDAEFSRSTQKLYFVTKSPDKLIEFDPINQQSRDLNLTYRPMFLSVSTSGNYIAVDNNGTASLIDVSQWRIQQSFTTGSTPSDVVIKDSSFIYSFPNTGGHVKVRCFDLNNNNIMHLSTGNSISDESRAVYNPQLDAIYIADNGVNPDDIEKVDVSNGVASYLYDSPYHGDFYFSGDLWLSEDGSRIYTLSKNVFTASNTQASDMLFTGAFEVNIRPALNQYRKDYDYYMKHAHHSLASGKVAVILKDKYGPSNKPIINQVYFHNPVNFNHINSIDVSDYAEEDRKNGNYIFSPGSPEFCFFTGNSDQIVVITKGVVAPFTNQWSIELINP
tara:strand:- start:2762 stop:4474 length:1713 start_codon:yes stop_codon:yes gene_type:complete